MRRLVMPFAAVLAGVATATTVLAQHADIEILSTADGGGALTSDADFGSPIRLADSLGFCPGGQCRYVNTNPGFVTPSAETRGLFALAPGTTVSLEVVAIDAGASVKVGSAIVDTPGERVVLGTALGLHTHPEWTLILPSGTVGDYDVSFRLTTESERYADSAVLTAVLTNRTGAAEPTATPTTPAATPTPTPTETAVVTPAESPTPTSTRAPAPCVGDCDGDGRITVSELVQGVNIVLGRSAVMRCPDFDSDGNGTVSVSELVQAVNAALAGCVSALAAP